ncbi:MAG: N-acetylmuramoyl-L-alanine amidase [Phenylobacterium sp.]
MKTIKYLVVHCSATPANRDIGAAEIRTMHRRQGWRDIGYHYVIRRNGVIEKGRPETEPGAHVQGHNSHSIGICMVGGVKPNMTAECNFTDEQFASLRKLLNELTAKYPTAKVCGHRDLSPDRNGDGKVAPGEWVKDCPTFEAGHWFATGELKLRP